MKSSVSRYNELSHDRTNALEKARRASIVTMPDFIPEDDVPQSNSTFKNSYSSFGNDAVGSLVTKLLYSILPSTQPFFRKEIDYDDLTSKDREILSSLIDGSGTIEEKIKETMISNSKKILKWFEEKHIRSVYNETLMNLIIAGNVVIKYTIDGAKNYKLNNFVIVRDNESNTIKELILKEKTYLSSIEEDEKSLIIEGSEINPDDESSLDMYTHILLNSDGKNYTITQEINEVTFKTVEDIPKDELPFVAPRIYRNSDSNYGDGYVFRFYDDLRDLNNYRKQYIQATAAITRILYLIDPNGKATVRDLAKKKSGDFAVGRTGDVTPLQPNNTLQVDVIGNIIDKIENKLRNNFLMLNIRQSERTTAEEIRATQEEIDQQLGGVFSTVSPELQLPSVKVVESLLRDNDKTFVFLPGTSDKIITGVEAIGRSKEMQQFRSFLGVITETANVKPEILDYINESYLADQILKSTGVDEKAFLTGTKVQEMRAARQQEQQQAQQAQMMQQQMIQSGGKMAENAMNNTQ